MATMTPDRTAARPSGARTLGLLIVPVLLLAGVIGLFVATNGAGLNVTPAVPVESVQFERPVLRSGRIEISFRNMSPQDVTIGQVNINNAFWPYTISPDRVVPRLGSAVLTLSYPWVEGSAYTITIFSSNSIPFVITIPVATTTNTPSSATLLSFVLIGLYVGVIPVILGMFWLPALRQLGPRVMLFLMAVTVGLLIFLGIDAIGEALELAAGVTGAFQGIGLIGIGAVATFLLLDAISRRQVAIGRSEASQRLTVAIMIAVGMGIHNLGEGLAIGAAYAVGAATLGTFLVIGFIVQNITEGLGIVMPVVRDRPSIRYLALLGLIGGAPAILGALIGGSVASPVLSLLFLAIGAGAVFEVVYEVAKIIQRDTARRPMPLTVFSGVTAGMLVLFVTGLLIK